MCKSRSDALPASSVASRSRRSSATTTTTSSSSSSRPGPASSSISGSTASAASSSSSSLAAARASLPDPPVLYPFHELAAATNNFLAKRAPASTYWPCTLRGHHAALFQLRRDTNKKPLLAATARYHHTSLAPLLGACLAGPHLYIAYELPPGAATLSACLRSPRNPNFTALRTWLSRVQVAADVAQGLEYIHHHAGAVHGRVSSSTVLVSDPGLRARLTHMGAAQLAGTDDEEEPSREADVRAFGLLLLELLSGEQAATYRVRSVVETAAAALASGRVRSWVDRRLGDSFPQAVAERLLEVGLRCACACASTEEEERPPPPPPPEMTWVAGKISKAYLDSRAWDHTLQRPQADLSSVSLAPR
uniref:Serine-threonine/tyrosine-protein kinase catalytic domain-containing protein n=1 Tax=Oryza punctata TaxID=4537 RepID=A0A0E0M4T6_ORYPU